MNVINIEKCTQQDQLKEVADIAQVIWHEYFPFLLSKDQIDYMVEKFQSYDAMVEQVEKQNYIYYQIQFNESLVGYIAVAVEQECLFLSKFYIQKEARNKGISTKAFHTILEITKELGKDKIRLTCNKYNTNSLDVYKHWGFEIVDSVVTDIGQGYVMDDYILEFKVL